MGKKKTTNDSSTRIDAIRHKDTRPNIPTEELRDFVADEEKAPKTMFYPRDPSLDPQLVWKGKDEQDAADLAVPVVPIYIQEKIHPQALIEDVRRTAAAAKQARTTAESGIGPQLDLFGDFNGLPEAFDQRVDFYHHEGNWSNRMILGDSLLVMSSLAEKEGLKGKVQMIYLDPPYGIKFGSNWQVSTRKRDVKDGKAEDATRQPEQVRAFRDTWKLGIHSYLAYLRDRLTAARELLTETGSCFVQIGDENVHLVRSVMDEVFGSENGAGFIAFKKTSGAGSFAGGTNLLPATSDYLLWYAKDVQRAKYRQVYLEREIGGAGAGAYTTVEEPDGRRRPATPTETEIGVVKGRFLRASPLTSETVREAQTTVFEVQLNGQKFLPRKGGWKTNRTGMANLAAAGRLMATGGSLAYVRYHDDFPAFPLTNLWNDTQSGSAMDKMYVVQTNPKVAERCLLMTTDPGDLVLDPTCGSGTTAYVAEQWGRRWITIDTSRVALALARTRLMAAKYPYYYLADDYPQVAQSSTDEEIKEHLRKSAKSADSPPGDIKKGFVYQRVPHVTLKSIANNPDIHEGMSRAEIDAAIARHTDVETLYDKPYEDNKRVRVAGPFTVESLSPHRVLSTSDENLDGTITEQEARKQQDFATMILDNLCKAGVQNTVKQERLVFERLEPLAGTWIHAAGEYWENTPQTTPTNAEKETGPKAESSSLNSASSVSSVARLLRRVAVSIGPEHGTVGPQQVKEAAKEAVQGVGFDVLIVCGFAFDPHVSEEAKRYGKLTVLPCRMNPDLAMGDELLKKTGAGNLFMVFGEPDVEIRTVSRADSPDSPPSKDKAAKRTTKSPPCSSVPSVVDLVVEIKGVDVYDPTTGAIRNSSTDDIACWFIDTNYNGESFFVRHAYFTGADEPYEKLKRALRADIDEAAWSALYSTISRPFPKPDTGKIAVKVINHYGDEVLKVFEV